MRYPRELFGAFLAYSLMPCFRRTFTTAQSGVWDGMASSPRALRCNRCVNAISIDCHRFGPVPTLERLVTIKWTNILHIIENEDSDLL